MIDTDTLRLGAVYDRLDDRLDELARSLADADDPAALRQVASGVDTQLGAVGWLIDRHGDDATVTVRGLTAGEHAHVEDRLAAMRDAADGDTIPGARTNVYAAAGLVDAPFLDAHDPDLDAALATITDLPVGVAKWLEAEVNDRTTVEGNEHVGLATRLAAASGAD